MKEIQFFKKYFLLLKTIFQKQQNIKKTVWCFKIIYDRMHKKMQKNYIQI